jgi:hypothetical protein
MKGQLLPHRSPRSAPRSMVGVMPAQAEGRHTRCLGCRLRFRMKTTMVSDLCRSMPRGARLVPRRFAFGVCMAAGSSFWHPPRPNPSIKRTCLRQAAYVER